METLNEQKNSCARALQFFAKSHNIMALVLAHLIAVLQQVKNVK